MRVQITQSDIDNGRRLSPGFCPISLAFKREMPGKKVSVKKTSMILGDEELFFIAPVTEFIYDFDMGKKVKPLSIRIADEEEGWSDSVLCSHAQYPSRITPYRGLG